MELKKGNNNISMQNTTDDKIPSKYDIILPIEEETYSDYDMKFSQKSTNRINNKIYMEE